MYVMMGHIAQVALAQVAVHTITTTPIILTVATLQAIITIPQHARVSMGDEQKKIGMELVLVNMGISDEQIAFEKVSV